MPVDLKKIQYSQEQKDKVLNFWNLNKNNPPSLGEIVGHLSDGLCTDPRAQPWGYLARQILLDAKIKPSKAAHEKIEGETFVVLTDEQKQFILNNIKDNRAIDLARTLFPNTKISPLGKEVRAINIYLESVGEKVIKPKEETMTTGKYEPPRTFFEILKKVNLYLHEELTTQNITSFDKKCLETTVQFINSPRFIQEMNNYQTVEKRISFESEFIRAVYSKPDLSSEEISLTINWCSDIIQASDIKKQLEKLNDILNDTAESAQGDEKAKLSMALSDTIGKVTTNLNEVLKREERIYGLLNKSRSKRDEEKSNKTANLAQLFEWFREEENRKKAVKQAELLKESRKNEVVRQENLSDTILLCLGMSRDNI